MQKKKPKSSKNDQSPSDNKSKSKKSKSNSFLNLSGTSNGTPRSSGGFTPVVSDKTKSKLSAFRVQEEVN